MCLTFTFTVLLSKPKTNVPGNNYMPATVFLSIDKCQMADIQSWLSHPFLTYVSPDNGYMSPHGLFEYTHMPHHTDNERGYMTNKP